MDIFEQATRTKLRFQTSKGMLTVEDLWDVPLQSKTSGINLDDIARRLSRELKEQATESFVDKPAKTDSATALAFDVVKHIIGVRLVERDAAALAAANKEKKQKLLEILARKEDEGLSALSADELRAQINAL